MKNLINLFKILAVATALFSCKKEVPSTPCSPSTPTIAQINSSIGGLVIDENKVPVNGATVTLGTHTTTTDTDGVFLFSNVQMNREKACVKVEKANYFLGARTLNPQENSVEHVLIKLLSKPYSGSFNTNSGGIVTSVEGVKINFQANSIENENGNPYSGQVNVAIKHLDPNFDDFPFIMPGNLIGKDASGNEKLLESYGMVAVELIGLAGEKLNLISGNTAELTVPLSGITLVSPPATIPLWSFNESTGIWDEEGSAALVGSEYVGDVSHFSFWNCDVPTDFVYISGKVKCGSTNMINALVQITRSGWYPGYGYTNSNGIYSGYVPKNQPLTIEIFPYNSCSGSIYSTPLGTFSINTTIPDITACYNSATSGILTVNLKDCNGNSITNGSLTVSMSPLSYYHLFPNSSGTINTYVDYCAFSTLTLVGKDLTNGKISNAITLNTGPSMNHGNLLVCSNPDQYINYTIDGLRHAILDSFTTYTNVSGETIIGGSHVTNWFELSINGTTTGSYTANNDIYVNQYIGSSSVPTTVNVNITTYGPIGGYIEGTFNGNFTDNNSTNHSLSGDFRVKRY